MSEEGWSWPEDSLDPADWNEFRELCQAAAAEVSSYLETVRSRPAWRPLPPEVLDLPRQEPPLDPAPLAAVIDEFRRTVFPYPTGNIHPRFFGWVHGTGLTAGVVAEMFAAAMNANLGGRNHAPVYVERAVIEWWRRIFGLPETASGLLVSGTSMGTVVALTAMRNRMIPGGIRRQGLRNAPPAAVYASAEVHQANVKALELLGLGSESLRRIPVDEGFRMRLDALRDAVSADRAAGVLPVCVIGTAGTVNTGAIDDLTSIAAFCQEQGLWFHLDGAFGALCVLSDTLRPRVAGIELADSIAFDFHKWMFVQYGAGCVLIRDESAHRDAFAYRESYLHGAERGAGGGDAWFCDYGPELSRGFLALKVWFAMKEHGIRKLGRVVLRNCLQAEYLRSRIRQHPDLRLLAGNLNVTCFRFEAGGLSPEQLDDLNADVVADLHESGIAVPSTTHIGGRLAIRAAITNHRTRREDLDLFLEETVRLARRRLSEMAPPA